ncbi:MAG: hypothetical protein IIA17_01155 [candidate division Zixibacteria bacterium]|nr:hypothetical protein [candidate division Zixibacteria bacterium]
MLYTSVEKVKQHLTSVFPVQDRITDQLVVLKSNDFVTFFGGTVSSSDFKVKSKQSNYLIRQSVTLGNPTTSLPDNLILRGSVVAASDSSLGMIYTENIDYIIDYDVGALTIKSGGALSSGQTILIWYTNYISYTKGMDYSLDSERGSLKRIAAGAITSGESVYLDYTPVYQSYTEELLQNAVDEANGLIEKTIDPDRQFGIEPAIQAAATYRALEIISRSSAARELSSLRGHDKVAAAWLKLVESYAGRADTLLKSFRPPFDSASAPVHS